MFKKILFAVWDRWKAFGHMLATFQSRVMLFVFYFIILAPFALLMRAFSDPLRLRPGLSPTWLERAAPDQDMSRLARRQF